MFYYLTWSNRDKMETLTADYAIKEQTHLVNLIECEALHQRMQVIYG